MKRGNAIKSVLASALLLAGNLAPAAEVVTLKVHHFLPPSSNTQTKLIEPWCAKIEKESNGGLKCQIYPAMQLGGTPPQLYDQVADGVSDIVWTLLGGQGGRFGVTMAFELPFVTVSSEKTSRALWTFMSKNAADEFKGVKPILAHVIGGMALHSSSVQIKTMADFKGLKVRAPTRTASQLLRFLGATPVPMPVPQVPESLAKGVVDAAMLPWEVVPALKVQEVVKYHTETDPSMPFMSSSVFLFAMNPEKYDSLPEHLKKVIDANSGANASAWAGKIWDDVTVPMRQVAVDRKNTFYTVPAAEVKVWQKAAESVTSEWIKEINAKGKNGQKLLDEARSLMN